MNTRNDKSTLFDNSILTRYNEAELVERITAGVLANLREQPANPQLGNCNLLVCDALAEEENNLPRIRQRIVVNGQTIHMSADSEAEMIAKLCQIINTQPAKEKPDEETPLFRDYVENWLDTYKAPTLKPSTLAGLKSYLKNHLLPYFGSFRLHKIKTDDIQKFLNLHASLSRSTLSDMLMWLKQILSCAMEDELIVRNPASSCRISIPSTKVKTREALTLSDFNDIVEQLSLLEEKDQLLMAIALYTGIRRGELLGLRYSDIDRKENVIRIRRSVVYASKNRGQVTTPKSKAGVRDIPILPQLLPYLPDDQSDRFLFSGDGTGEEPLTSQQFQNTWTRINGMLDLHGATLHTLRHTFITLAIASGMDVKSVQSIAGHANAAITTDRYAHALMEQKKSAIITMANFIKDPVPQMYQTTS